MVVRGAVAWEGWHDRRRFREWPAFQFRDSEAESLDFFEAQAEPKGEAGAIQQPNPPFGRPRPLGLWPFR